MDRMTRVIINTPGKVLNYRDYPSVRTPTYFDVKKEELQGFLSMLKLYGVDDYEVTTMPVKVEKKTNKKKASKLKQKMFGRVKKRIGMNISIK
jgi:hypothetical protein